MKAALINISPAPKATAVMRFAAQTLIPAFAVLALTAGATALAADARLLRPDPAVCTEDVRCRRPPGPPDRDIRPLIDPLGRPCGLRWRETPSGTRRVRVCT